VRNYIRRLRFWLWRRFRTVDVWAYGAYGDGKHDDTAAIQCAIDAAGKRFVLLPRAHYSITGPLRFHRRTVLFGEKGAR
jgi:hypothetical protein